MGILSDIFSNFVEIQSLYNKNGPWIVYEALSMLNLDLFGFGLPDILTGTCAICVALNNCYFYNNKDKLPKPIYESENIITGQIHENCRCLLTKISKPKTYHIEPHFPLRKFSEYIFNDDITKNKGKKYLFESWGYTKKDSGFLKNEYEKQVREKYINAQYEINKLDNYGQRINIEIDLSTPVGKQVSIISGWIVMPYGKLKNTTPYGGK